MKAATDIYGTFVDNLRKHSGTSLALAFGVGAYSLAHGATALAAGLLARVLATNPTGGELREGGELGQMIGRLGPADLVLLGLIATGVKAIASVIVTFLEIRTGADVAEGARKQSIAALLERGQRFAGPRTLASLSSRCRELEQAIVFGVIHGGRALAQLVPLAAALILLSPWLALVGAVALLPFVIVLTKLRQLWRTSVARAQDLGDELLVGVDDLVANLDLWRSYSAGTRAQASIAATARLACDASARAGASRAALSGFNEVLAVIALLGAVALAPTLGISSAGGTLFGFAAVFFMAYRPLRDLGDARGWILRGNVAIAAILKLAGDEAPKTIAARPVRTPRASPGTGLLELKGFGSRRLGAATTLQAAPGSLVALVGPTGSGKTSLLRALLGLEPALGQVWFAGRDVSEAAVGPPDRPFAWVPQEAPIVADTLLGNIGLFSDNTRARSALSLIGADYLFEELGETRLGPGGRTLSGGERRLVSLARALASELPVLLLDEPTEGLDAEARRKVLGALRHLRGKRTVLLVTHHPEVWAIADSVSELGPSPDASAEPDSNVA